MSLRIWNSIWTAAQYLLIVVCAVGAISAGYTLVKFATADPSGEANNNCVVEEFSSAPNGEKLVATAHTLWCGYFIGHGGGSTFVYLHKLGEPDNGKSLVFRFDNSGGDQLRPQMTWTGTSSLLISIPRVGEVTKQVELAEGIRISYSIGTENFPRGESSRGAHRVEGILFVIMLVCLTMCAVIIGSLRRAGAP